MPFAFLFEVLAGAFLFLVVAFKYFGAPLVLLDYSLISRGGSTRGERGPQPELPQQPGGCNLGNRQFHRLKTLRAAEVASHKTATTQDASFGLVHCSN